jgi:hypothetical protein
VPENPFTLTVRATVTVTDLDALVRQVDEVVDRSDDIEPLEGGTSGTDGRTARAPATPGCR